MHRLVFCAKLKKEAEGLAHPPYPGVLGERIYQEICKEAWQQWLKHQTLLINEKRLNMSIPENRQFLAVEMDKFFFKDGSNTPEGFIAPT